MDKPVARLQDEISDRPYTEGEKFFDVVILDRAACVDGMELYAHPAAPAVDAAKLDDLGKLKALAEAATPGPWTYRPMTETEDPEIGAANGSRVAALVAADMTKANSAFIAAANPAAILRIAALVAQQAARIAELEGRSLIPEGWEFLSADFSRQAMSGLKDGHVTLVRDEPGRVAWHAMGEEVRKADGFELYAYGSGPTIGAALIAARASVEGK